VSLVLQHKVRISYFNAAVVVSRLAKTGKNLFLPGWFKPLLAETCQLCKYMSAMPNDT